MFTGWILNKILTATLLDAYAQKLPVDILIVIHREIKKATVFCGFLGFPNPLIHIFVFGHVRNRTFKPAGAFLKPRTSSAVKSVDKPSAADLTLLIGIERIKAVQGFQIFATERKF